MVLRRPVRSHAAHADGELKNIFLDQGQVLKTYGKAQFLELGTIHIYFYMNTYIQVFYTILSAAYSVAN